LAHCVLELWSTLKLKSVCVSMSLSMSGVSKLFWYWAKFDNYFSLRSALFQISDDEVTISAKQKKLVLFMLLLTVFDKNFGCKRSMLPFLITEKGPRAAKISWRAALWPCLVYVIVCYVSWECISYQTHYKFYVYKKV